MPIMRRLLLVLALVAVVGCDAPSAPSTEAVHGISYWLSRGFTTADMFDEHGQMRPGWTRTQDGYAYSPPVATVAQIRQWFQLYQHCTPSQAAIDALLRSPLSAAGIEAYIRGTVDANGYPPPGAGRAADDCLP